MEIRDTRNGEWHWVYNALLADPHLTVADKLVYSAISTFGGHEVIHPTLDQIGERCNASERQVRYSLRRLEEVDYISVDKSTGRGNANVYYLLKMPKGCKLCPFYKGGKEEHERGQNTTVKGEHIAPHIDKKDSIDKEKTFSLERQEIEVFDGDEPKREKVPPSKVPEWVEIWNRYPNWKAVGKTGTPPNPSVAKSLLPNTPSTDDIRSAVIRKRTKYTPAQFEQVVKNYVLEIVNRTKDKNGFYLHRYTMYEFLTHKNIFERYANR